MTEFLATFQVAYPELSVSTGLKPCALSSWAFSPQTADDCDIVTRPRDKDLGNLVPPCFEKSGFPAVV